MIEMAVFDMAGTVVNEQNVVYRTLHETLNKAGVEVDFPTVLLLGAGKEKKQALTEILKQIRPDAASQWMINQCYIRFRDNLKDAYDRLQVTSQPGAEEIFQYLNERNVFIVLNTGYDRTTAEQLLGKLGWMEGEDFDYLVTASDVLASRPAPDMIQFAMREFRIRHPYYVIKVGDSIVDIEEGRNADCRYVIGVTTGAHTREQLLQAQPTHVIDHLSGLKEIIEASTAIDASIAS